MKENELIEEISKLSRSINGYSIIKDAYNTSPFSMGYWQKDDKWIVYMTNERGELQLEKSFESKDQALGYLHELMRFEISLSE